MPGQVPANNLPAGNVLDGREVSQLAVEGQVSNVGAKCLPGTLLLEMPVQDIAERPVLPSLFQNLLVGISPPDFSDQMILVLNPDYLFMIHDYALTLKLHLDGTPAVFSFPLVKDGFDEQIILIILWLLLGLRLEPFVITGSGDPGSLAEKPGIYAKLLDYSELLKRL